MRWCRRLLCTRVLPSGLKLDGIFDPTTNHLTKGIATHPDGRVYKGEFDRINGTPLPGTQLEEDGDLYKGAFNSSWQRSGAGEAFLLDGTHFSGEFADDELVVGTVRVPDEHSTSETVFEGSLRNEEFLDGVLRTREYTYVGSFKDNMPHGKGKIVFHTGAEQEGTFLQGKLHGSTCTMKLESGIVYSGDFVNGVIRRGMLYTPTYHYDGEFSEDGRANGEGTQIYLATSPKLIFTGLWLDGNLVRGSCQDEHGAPVDWVDNHELQKEVIGLKTASSNTAQQAVRRDANDRANSVREAFIDDAKEVSRSSGRYPSEAELGYTSSRDDMPTDSEMAMKAPPVSSLHHTQEYKDYMQYINSLDDDAAIDKNKAKSYVSSQISSEKISAEHMENQFKRFKSGSTGSLNVDNNFNWRQDLPH